MNLRPDEVELVGQWVFDGRVSHADAASDRIKHLTEHTLQKVAVSKDYGGWETLYRDPTDGRLWERTYPQGDMHGGGPPRLAVIAPEDARKKYGVP